MLCDVTFVGRDLSWFWAHCVQTAFKTTSVHKETYTGTPPSLLENCPILQRAENSLFDSPSQENMMILNNDYCLHACKYWTPSNVSCWAAFKTTFSYTKAHTCYREPGHYYFAPFLFRIFSTTMLYLSDISRFESKMVNIESQLSGYHLVGLPNTSLLLRLYSAIA